MTTQETEGITGAELIEAADLTDCELTLPMAQWVVEKDEDPEKCVPCSLGTITPWYRDFLEKAGLHELAARVDGLAEGEPTNLDVAKVLDEVKAAVDNGDVRSNLELYDCMAQSYTEEES